MLVGVIVKILVRLVKQVINEQSIPEPEKISADHAKFEEYVKTKWGWKEDPYASIDFEGGDNKFTICDGPCGSLIPGTDVNSVTWDGKTKTVYGTVSFGVDPKPISWSYKFNQMKTWFDSSFG